MTAPTRPLALVTGASSGLGVCFAERLAARGMDLVLVARRRERLEALAETLSAAHGVEAEVLPADLGDRDALAAVATRAEAEPRLSFLVNNAGFGTAGAFEEIAPERIEQEILLNLVAVSRLARAAVPGMRRRGAGTILNVASSAGIQPSPFISNYAATKAGVIHLTRALAGELRGSGVRLQALCPGPVPTEFSAVAGADEDALPSFMFQSTEACVDASLRALERGTVVFTPLRLMRIANAATALLPLRWKLPILAHFLKPSESGTTRSG